MPIHAPAPMPAPAHSVASIDAAATAAVAAALGQDMQQDGRTLLRQKALLDSTLESIDQGLVMIDIDGTVVVANRRAEEILGLPAEYLASRPHYTDVRRRLLDQGALLHENLQGTQAARPQSRPGDAGGPSLRGREGPRDATSCTLR